MAGKAVDIAFDKLDRSIRYDYFEALRIEHCEYENEEDEDLRYSDKVGVKNLAVSLCHAHSSNDCHG